MMVSQKNKSKLDWIQYCNATLDLVLLVLSWDTLCLVTGTMFKEECIGIGDNPEVNVNEDTGLGMPAVQRKIERTRYVYLGGGEHDNSFQIFSRLP